MMRLFLDSSALAKRYVSETGTPAVNSLCAEASEIILCVVAVPEIVSAFNRLRRDGLSSRRYSSLKKDLAADVAQATIVPLAEDVLKRTIETLEKTPLRTLDAMHVASAIESSPDLFVTSDHRQAEAGRSLGLDVREIKS